MLSASQAGVPSRWFDRALATRPDLVDAAGRAVAACADGSPESALAIVERDHPDAYAALVLLVQAAYFMSPKAQRRIGFRAHRAAPIYPDEADLDLDDGALLDAVRNRGAIFIPTPAGPNRA